jgi:hypothetical protein
MKRLVIAGLTLLALIAGSCVGIVERDRRARQEILDAVAKQLPVGSEEVKMTAFMTRHTVSYSLDDRMNHEYVGIVPQSWINREPASRKVFIHLRFNPNRTFKEAVVEISYTLP